MVLVGGKKGARVMSKQLTIFDAVSDKKIASLTDPVSERKRQAMSRFLARAKDNEACVNKYSPGKRKKEYFRLSVRQGKGVKHFHIRGGNVNAKLAQFRANQLQQMIDRGAELGEIIAAVEDYGSQN